jgi:sulfotransferase family protein
MKKPDLFIAGAPKSGTTALSKYLSEHPNVFITTPKEPNFFSDDMPKRYIAQSLEDYLLLFKNCNSNHYVSGEASVYYLYSSCALQNIYNFYKQAKIIVLLRNPVDIVYSLHSQYIYNFTEDEKDFEKAWNFQESRKMGLNLPVNCKIPKILQYKDIAMLGNQVEKLFSIFSKDQVKLILFEDFVDSTKEVYEDVLKFLGIPSVGKASFPRINENRIPRVLKLSHFLHNPPNIIRKIVRILYNTFGIDAGEKFMRFISDLNSCKVERKRMSPDFRKRLITEFQEDIHKLSIIINRDLSHWER